MTQSEKKTYANKTISYKAKQHDTSKYLLQHDCVPTKDGRFKQSSATQLVQLIDLRIQPSYPRNICSIN